MRGITLARRKRQPFDPNKQPHDRRATEINRGQLGHIFFVEVDNPLAEEPGEKIIATRSVRGDPLGDHFARKHIDQAQYDAGREFQRHFGIAERGPRAVQWSEAVDGDPPRENLTDGQLLAGKWLARIYRRLGIDGSAIVHDVLIHNMTARAVAASRGLNGRQWEEYFAKRLWECLNSVAFIYGYSREDSDRRRLVPIPCRGT